MELKKEQYLRERAREIRSLTLRSIASIGTGHIGGSLSIAELLAVLYFDRMRIRPTQPDWDARDKHVLSKGHAGPALYSALALRGYFSEELLYTLNQPHTRLPSHGDMRRTPGIDMTTGSLGQGASTAAGLALAQKMDGIDAKTYVILGDGECQEGQVWEAMLFAAHHRLTNLVVFVDCNGMQIDGTTDAVCSLGGLTEKFRAFGLSAREAGGHAPAEIAAALDWAETSGRPAAIVLHTIKGYGVTAFEGSLASHHAALPQTLLEQCLRELEGEEMYR